MKMDQSTKEVMSLNASHQKVFTDSPVRPIQVPLENRSIFSGALFQFLEENNKWRNHFIFVPDSYTINYYDNKAVRKDLIQMPPPHYDGAFVSISELANKMCQSL